ncbi:hypothetical protein SCARD494_01781 [Seiridium cardinale]
MKDLIPYHLSLSDSALLKDIEQDDTASSDESGTRKTCNTAPDMTVVRKVLCKHRFMIQNHHIFTDGTYTVSRLRPIATQNPSSNGFWSRTYNNVAFAFRETYAIWMDLRGLMAARRELRRQGSLQPGGLYEVGSDLPGRDDTCMVTIVPIVDLL